MILILKLISLTTIWCLGLTIASQNEMVLGFLRRRLTDGEGNPLRRIYEPLLLCEWCMPSIHALVCYGIAVGLGIINNWSWSLLFAYPIVVMASSFCTGILWSVFKLIEVVTKYFTHTEKIIFFELKDRIKKYKELNNLKIKRNGVNFKDSRNGVG